MKSLLRAWILALLRPVPLVGLLYLPRYITHWRRYTRASGEGVPLADSYPCLTDWVAHTPFDPHYFYQAAWLARQLANDRPMRHVDIGSDVKMVGVISGFVPTEFLDYRPLIATLDGLTCGRADLLGLEIADASILSLSCLHVVEHIGLGRYGDDIDPSGSRRALTELQRVVAPGGRLFLSLPVGRERVCFNAHRVFAPQSILAMLPDMKLISFAFVDDSGAYHPSADISMVGTLEYGCGMFVLEKL